MSTVLQNITYKSVFRDTGTTKATWQDKSFAIEHLLLLKGDSVQQLEKEFCPSHEMIKHHFLYLRTISHHLHSCAVRTTQILPSGSERVTNCLRGRKNGFFVTHMDHLDSSGFIYFSALRKKSHPHKSCRCPKNPFEWLKSIAFPLFMEKSLPSAWAERGFCAISCDSS